MSDPWTTAWEEAEAAVPASVLVYTTLELRHPAFLDGNGDPMAVRIVNGVPDAMSFTLESDAPLDAGETVAFEAMPFSAERPEFAEGRLPECAVSIDNVTKEVLPLLEKAVQYRADLIVAYREYRSDDLTAPCYGPVEFKMRKVSVSGTTITGTARLDNLANRKFPNKNYTIAEYPGLLA